MLSNEQITDWLNVSEPVTGVHYIRHKTLVEILTQAREALEVPQLRQEVERLERERDEWKLLVQGFLMAPAMDKEQLHELIQDAKNMFNVYPYYRGDNNAAK